MVEGGLCCCLFVSFFWGEGKLWLWLTIFKCLPVCGWREQGSRGCGMVMESCFDHAMIHLSAYMMGWGGGGGGASHGCGIHVMLSLNF